MRAPKMDVDGLVISRLFSVEGKVVVVSGGSTGIGKAIAMSFVRNHCRVFITGRDVAACSASAAEMNAVGPGSCVAFPGDISTQEGCVMFAKKVLESVDHVDVLVNNAGATWGAPFESFSEAAWNKVLDLNVKSVFYLSRAFMPALKKNASRETPAKIINIGSVAGLDRGMEGNAFSYTASKAAVHQLTRHLAGHFAGENVLVNAIACGAFESKMMAFAFDGVGEEGLGAGIPLGRTGRASDIGGLCIFLASTAGNWITGAVIPLDGGSIVKPAAI